MGESETGCCWEIRGCDDEMMGRCPHVVEGVYSPCPPECRYTVCERPTRAVARDFALLLDANVDRSAAIKEVCWHCEFFLKDGPRIA